jgi:hypothetical protein
MIYLKTILFFLLLILCSCKLISNNHISIGLNYINDEYFTKILSISNEAKCCPEYLSGKGKSYNIKLHYDYKFFKDIPINLGLGLDLQNSNFYIFYDENEFININGDPFQGIFRHSVDFDFQSINPKLNFTYIIYNWIFKFSFGTIIVLNNNFTEMEEIILPIDKGVFFENNSRKRNITKGKISDIILPINTSIIISYKLKLNNKGDINLEPNFLFNYLSSFIQNKTFNSIGYGFGLNLLIIF